MSEDCKDCGKNPAEHPGESRKPESPVSDSVTEASGQTTLKVAGMDCPDEIAAIERVLKPLAGVGEIKVNLMAGTATILHDKRVTPEQLIQAIGTAGLKASAMDGGETEDEHSGDASRVHLLLVIVSGVFTGASLLFQWQNLSVPYGKAAAAIVAIIAGGWFIFPKAIRALRHVSLDMNVLMDLTAVDGLEMKWKPRFELVCHFYSLSQNHLLRVKIPVEERDPVVASLTSLWPIADWLEREVWDMFGIRFEGHPNLKRILMYEEFKGHDLRKDYPYSKRQPLIGPKN